MRPRARQAELDSIRCTDFLFPLVLLTHIEAARFQSCVVRLYFRTIDKVSAIAFQLHFTMSVDGLLQEYQQLGAEILLLLNLQLARGHVIVPAVDELKTYLYDYGEPFVVHHANDYLQSEDGRSDLDYIMKTLTNHIEPNTCLDNRRSCPCKHETRRECDALLDLSLRMIVAVVEAVQKASEEMEVENLIDD